MAKEQADSTVKEAATAKAPEAEYTVKELTAAAASIFKGVSQDCVTAAFRVAGIEKATKSKAQEIVNKFSKKEVK